MNTAAGVIGWSGQISDQREWTHPSSLSATHPHPSTYHLPELSKMSKPVYFCQSRTLALGRSSCPLPLNILYDDARCPHFPFPLPVACIALKVQPGCCRKMRNSGCNQNFLFLSEILVLRGVEPKPILGQFLGPRQKRDYIRQLLLDTSDWLAAFWPTWNTLSWKYFANYVNIGQISCVGVVSLCVL